MTKEKLPKRFANFFIALGIILLYLLIPSLLQMLFAKPIVYLSQKMTSGLVKLISLFNLSISTKVVETIYNTSVSIFLLLIQIIAVLVVIIIFRQSLKEELQEFKNKNGSLFKDNFKYYAIGYGISILINLVITTIFHTSTSVNETNNRDLMTIYPLYALPTIALLAPLAEEIVFRKSFQNVFKNKTIFILFTGILFGSIHVVSSLTLANLFYALSYSALGIALSYTYAKTENIFTSISLHTFHNCLMIFLLIINYLI